MVLDVKRKEFAIEYVQTGNASQAFKKAFPERAKNMSVSTITTSASRMLTNVDNQSEIEKQRCLIERAASKAAVRIGKLVESEDESIALNTSKWLFEQVHGKAMQKSLNLNVNMDAESILDQLQPS